MFRSFSFSRWVQILVLLVLGGPSCSLASEAGAKLEREATFYAAVEKNDLVQAKSLLENGVDPNARVPGKWLNQTPLEAAVGKGNTEMAGLLLQYKADPLLEDENGDTAFVYATDHPKIMALFRERGLSLDTRNSQGQTPLLRIMAYAKAERILSILKAGADPATSNAEGETPLMASASDEKIEVFRLILPKVDLNAQNADGETALMKAVGNRSTKAVGLLLEAKADLESRDRQGRTVLGRAVRNPNPDLAFLLLDKGSRWDIRENKGATPLMAAYDARLVEKLIALGASPTAADNDGDTALHFMASRSSWYAPTDEERQAKIQNTRRILAALIKQGANVNARDGKGATPLHFATREGEIPTIKALLAAGAEMDAADKTGQSPLGWAVQRMDRDTVALLLQAGAVSRPQPGCDPAATAALAGQSDLLKLLLAHGAAEKKEDLGRLLLAATSGYQDNYHPEGRLECIRELVKQPLEANARDGKEMTPLMWAAASDSPEAVELILKSGGDVAARDNKGRDALSWAASAGAVYAIPLLLAHGASLDSRDNVKQTALDWAKICNQEKALTLLQKTPPP